MTRRFALLLILLVFAGLGPASDAAPIREVADQVRPAVVEIIGTVLATGDTSYGTGFALEDPTLVVTNAHVVRGVREAMVRTYEGALIASVEILHVDERVDLAVLRVKGLHAAALSLDESRAAEVGDPVVTVGHPRGYEFTVSNGIVSAVRSLDAGGVRLIQTTAPISPGSSGGPLLDTHGKVVGVCSLTLTEGQNINFAVPAVEVRPVLDEALRIERSLAAADTRKLPADALVRLVRRHRESGDLVRAGDLVHEALALHPKSLPLLREAAEVAWSSSNYQEVASLVDRMQEISPDYAPGRQIRAAYFAQVGRCQDAVDEARRSLGGQLEKEQAAEAHAVLAECLGRLGDVGSALGHVERALESPAIASLPDYHVLQAFLLQASGRDDEADLSAVAALQAAEWDPLVQSALRERGLPRLLEILSSRGGVRGEDYVVRGVLRNRGPITIGSIMVTAEGYDGEGAVVATGTVEVQPERLVSGQTGSFAVVLGGAPEDVERFAVRVVDYRD